MLFFLWEVVVLGKIPASMASAGDNFLLKSSFFPQVNITFYSLHTQKIFFNHLQIILESADLSCKDTTLDLVLCLTASRQTHFSAWCHCDNFSMCLPLLILQENQHYFWCSYTYSYYSCWFIGKEVKV